MNFYYCHIQICNKKMVIKEVVLYADKKIEATKNVIQN